MTAEHPPTLPPDASTPDAQALRQAGDWLDGLAGRPRPAPSEGAAESESQEAWQQGQRLRRGLDRLPQPPLAAMDWAEVRARAGLQLQPAAVTALKNPPPESANHSPLRHSKPSGGRWAWGLAASFMLGGVLLWPLLSSKDSGSAEGAWRGAPPTPEAAVAVWKVGDVAEMAHLSEALSVQLEALGASVEIASRMPSGARDRDGLWLHIRCAAACDAARVDQRLAELETALQPAADGTRSLSLKLLPH